MAFALVSSKKLSLTTIKHSKGYMILMILAIDSYTERLILKSTYIFLLTQFEKNRNNGKNNITVPTIME